MIDCRCFPVGGHGLRLMFSQGGAIGRGRGVAWLVERRAAARMIRVAAGRSFSSSMVHIDMHQTIGCAALPARTLALWDAGTLVRWDALRCAEACAARLPLQPRCELRDGRGVERQLHGRCAGSAWAADATGGCSAAQAGAPGMWAARTHAGALMGRRSMLARSGFQIRGASGSRVAPAAHWPMRPMLLALSLGPAKAALHQFQVSSRPHVLVLALSCLVPASARRPRLLPFAHLLVPFAHLLPQPRALRFIPPRGILDPRPARLLGFRFDRRCFLAPPKRALRGLIRPASAQVRPRASPAHLLSNTTSFVRHAARCTASSCRRCLRAPGLPVDAGSAAVIAISHNTAPRPCPPSRIGPIVKNFTRFHAS